MSITEIVTLVGAENIEVQGIVQNLVRVDNPKHGQCSKITVTIPPDIGQELCAATMANQRPRKTGLIIWFDTNRLPPPPAAQAKEGSE